MIMAMCAGEERTRFSVARRQKNRPLDEDRLFALGSRPRRYRRSRPRASRSWPGNPGPAGGAPRSCVRRSGRRSIRRPLHTQVRCRSGRRRWPGNVRSFLPPHAIRPADVDLVQTCQHVELGHGQRIDAVDPGGVFDGYAVEPAAAAGASGRGAVFSAFLAQGVRPSRRSTRWGRGLRPRGWYRP